MKIVARFAGKNRKELVEAIRDLAKEIEKDREDNGYAVTESGAQWDWDLISAKPSDTELDINTDFAKVIGKWNKE